MFKITRGAEKPVTLSLKMLESSAKTKSDAVESSIAFRMDVTEEQLYQWFSVLIKSRFHLTPFFQIETPSTYFPGTVKYAPPTPFAVTEVEGGFDVGVTAIVDWKGIYVLATIFRNAVAWTKSEHGGGRLGIKKKIKRATFENLLLRGKAISLSERKRRTAAVAASAGDINVPDSVLDEADED